MVEGAISEILLFCLVRCTYIAVAGIEQMIPFATTVSNSQKAVTLVCMIFVKEL